jgi:hypothetical protein
MRRIAILIVVLGLSAVGGSPAAAQLPESPLPDLPAPLPDLPVPEVPDVESPELPGDDGGSSPVPSVTPGVGSGGGSGGGSSGGGSSGGGSSGSREGSGSDSCPCAAPASGYPVAGDYDKCPVENGPHGAVRDDAAGLAASRSDGSSGAGANGAAGGVLGAGAYGGDASQPPSADDGALLGEGSARSVLAGVLFALIGVGLLVGIGGGLRAYRQGFP